MSSNVNCESSVSKQAILLNMQNTIITHSVQKKIILFQQKYHITVHTARAKLLQW